MHEIEDDGPHTRMRAARALTVALRKVAEGATVPA